MPKITGQFQLPGTEPLRGTWYVEVNTDTGYYILGDGLKIVAAADSVEDTGQGATIDDLKAGVPYRATFVSKPDGAKRSRTYGPYAFVLTGDTTWGLIVDTPQPLPIAPPSDADLALQYRTEAYEARDAAAASAEAAAAPVDGAMASRINDTGSATRGAIEGLGYARTANRPVTLRDNTAIDFTGASNSRTALREAIDAAGAGTPIELGRSGVIRCDTPLGTLPQFQSLNGPGLYEGVGGTAPAEIRFPNLTADQVAIGSDNNTFAGLVVRGPGAAGNTVTGIRSVVGTPKFHRVNFIGWQFAAKLTSTYYAVFDNCVWSRNRYGIDLSGADVFNLDLFKPMMYCAYGSGDSQFGVGINGGARGMKIKGGSIEGYGAGGAISLTSASALQLSGVYFESILGSNAFGVVAAGVSQVTIGMRENFIYLGHHNRFVHLDGATSSVLVSEANHFNCPTTSPTDPIAYVLPTSGVRGRVGYDNWAEVAKTSAAYVAPTAVQNAGHLPGLEIYHPNKRYLGSMECGTVTPEGNVYGSAGDWYSYLAVGGTATAYFKASGNGTNTGWVAK